MMLFSFDIHIKTTNQLLISDVESILPIATDNRIAPEYYQLKQIVDQFDSLPVLSGMIRFNDDNDRISIFDEVMSVDGIFTGCEIGSYIKFHDCNLANEDKTERRCFDEIVFEVTP